MKQLEAIRQNPLLPYLRFHQVLDNFDVIPDERPVPLYRRVTELIKEGDVVINYHKKRVRYIHDHKGELIKLGVPVREEPLPPIVEPIIP